MTIVKTGFGSEPHQGTATATGSANHCTWHLHWYPVAPVQSPSCTGTPLTLTVDGYKR